ncbi:MAG: peptidoglycan DD-metalloendopeptidase family protein [Bacillota bacterium]|nr:peptidoglycan DD-metalloendopeptidase family protein [Bacillota bacterium]
MRTRLRLACFLIALLLAAVLAVSCVALGEPSSELSHKRDQLGDVTDQMQETKKQLLTVKQKEKGVLGEIQKAEMDLEKTRARLASLERQAKRLVQAVAQAERDLAAAEDDLAEARKRLDRTLSALKGRLRAIYMSGPADYLEVLFSSRDFADFVCRFEYVEILAENDARCLDEARAEVAVIEAKMAEVARRKAKLQKEREDLARVQAQVKVQEAELAARVREREAVLARIQKERTRYEQALDELEEMSRELERAIRELQAREAKAGRSLPRWNGKLIMPVNGKISSDFGMRFHPILRTSRFHSGIDIAVPSGTPVLAAADGVVIYSGWISGYGYTVIIDHGGGLSTLYGHNSSLLVKSGQSVLQGDRVARSGSTGLSTGPHVHFEVRDDGTPVNPWQWLK